MAGVEDGSVIVLRALVQAVAAGLAVPHLKDNTGDKGNEEETRRMAPKGCFSKTFLFQ